MREEGREKEKNTEGKRERKKGRAFGLNVLRLSRRENVVERLFSPRCDAIIGFRNEALPRQLMRIIADNARDNPHLRR